MLDRRSTPLLVFAATALVAAASLTWFVADLVYDIGLPRCASGRRSVSCGGDHGWHDTSLVVSSLVTVPALFTLVGAYLYVSSRVVRAEKAKRRDARRSALRRQFGWVLLTTVVVTVPAALLIRSAL